MGILTFTFILFMLPLDITFFFSLIYRPKTSKWQDISYRCAFLNNLFNPILYLSLMRTGSGAVASLICGTIPSNSERSVPFGTILMSNGSCATSRSSSCRGQHSTTMISQSFSTELQLSVVHLRDHFSCKMCDYITKNKTELTKHERKHKNRDRGHGSRQNTVRLGTEHHYD